MSAARAADGGADAPLFWPLLRQGSTLALAMVSHALVNLVDLWLVGKCGPAAVAGVHVATTVNFLPMIVGNGVSVASMALMAQAVGAGDLARARGIGTRAFTWMLLLGIVLGAALATLTVPSVAVQGATGEARTIGVEYLLVANLGTVSMFALMQVTASMRAAGETLVPLLLLLGANVLNLGLGVLLIFGWDVVGVPALGAVGSAYATVAARAAAALAGVGWLRRGVHPLRLGRLHLRGGAPGELRRLLSIGAPQSLQMVVRTAAVIAITAVAAAVAGETALTALGVTTRLDTILLFGAAGFASAATTTVGHAVGAGQVRRARRAAEVAAVLAFGFSLLLAVGLWSRADWLIGTFVAGADPSIVAIGTCYLAVGVLGQPFSCLAICASGGVNGAGRAFAPLAIDALVYGSLLAPAIWWAAAGGFDPLLGQLWLALAGTHVALALGHGVYVLRGRWVAA